MNKNYNQTLKKFFLQKRRDSTSEKFKTDFTIVKKEISK